MIAELYFVAAILCDKRDCWRQTVWTGRDRTQCMIEAMRIKDNPPARVTEVKMSACLVERTKPGHEWAPQGYWRKISD